MLVASWISSSFNKKQWSIASTTLCVRQLLTIDTGLWFRNTRNRLKADNDQTNYSTVIHEIDHIMVTKGHKFFVILNTKLWKLNGAFVSSPAYFIPLLKSFSNKIALMLFKILCGYRKKWLIFTHCFWLGCLLITYLSLKSRKCSSFLSVKYGDTFLIISQ